jgi:hypothetical protein
MMRRSLLLLSCWALTSCVGTTGSELVDFSAFAAGPASANSPYSFTTDRGYEVTLTRGKLHVGAAYLDSAMPSLGSQETSCILPGLYVASVPGPVDVDVLSGTLQPFSARGEGTATQSLAGELWLTSGDINAPDDITVILDVAGTAMKDSSSWPFDGKVTIGENRSIRASDPSQPGAHPICKQRIVSPIPVDLTPKAGGALLIRIDPAGWFANVDFSKLSASPSDPEAYEFSDDNSNQPSLNLYSGLLQANSGTYQFSWQAGLD